jgi:hypothetical protein
VEAIFIDNLAVVTRFRRYCQENLCRKRCDKEKDESECKASRQHGKAERASNPEENTPIRKS